MVGNIWMDQMALCFSSAPLKACFLSFAPMLMWWMFNREQSYELETLPCVCIHISFPLCGRIAIPVLSWAKFQLTILKNIYLGIDQMTLDLLHLSRKWLCCPFTHLSFLSLCSQALKLNLPPGHMNSSIFPGKSFLHLLTNCAGQSGQAALWKVAQI